MKKKIIAILLLAGLIIGAASASAASKTGSGTITTFQADPGGGGH